MAAQIGHAADSAERTQRGACRVDECRPSPATNDSPVINTSPTPNPISTFLTKLFMTLPGTTNPRPHLEGIAARACAASEATNPPRFA